MKTTTSRRRHSRAARVSAGVALVFGGLIAALAWGPALVGDEAPHEAAAASTPTAAFPSAADFCYAQMMIPHHEQAVEMSAILLARPDISERSRKFAEFVSSDQSTEVTATKAWIESWRAEYRENPPRSTATTLPDITHHGAVTAPEPQPAAPDVDVEFDVDRVVDCGDASDPARFATMAGMLTPAQLDELRAAADHDAEILYLSLMIPHHEGALAMSRDVVQTGTNYFTVQMAKHILNEQNREIDAMAKMITEIS